MEGNLSLSPDSGFPMPFLLLLLMLWPPAPRPRESGQPPQAHPIRRQQQASSQQRGTDSAPLVVKVSPPQAAELVAAQVSNQHEQKPATDWWMFGVTGLLVVVGLGQLLYFREQASQLKKTVEGMGRQEGLTRESVDIAVKSADAAKEAADATKASVAAMRENAEKQLRAYLSLGEGTITDQDDTPLRFEWRPKIENCGQTPALDVVVFSNIEVLEYPLPPGHDFAVPPATDPSKSLIGPGQYTIPTRTLRRLNPEELSRVRRLDGRAIFVWGKVTYTDVFGAPRWTRFCQFATWNTNKTITPLASRAQ